ncbi:MAG: hypothetical protein MZU91_11975 [Desulfosudis oleivorans]|nr:hypothetical protein [Desulfosudis oleivorans]
MKPAAFLINTSRGEVVDENALLGALNSGQISGAALDVFETEPPADRALVEHPRVVTAPHMAGLTNEARYRLGRGASERILCAFRGETPPNVVNKPVNPRYLRKRIKTLHFHRRAHRGHREKMKFQKSRIVLGNLFTIGRRKALLN